MPKSKPRMVAGALLIDGPRLLHCLCSRHGWVNMGNRHDCLLPGPGGRGWRCEWEFSRSLHICDVLSHCANWLLRRALAQWPILLDAKSDHRPLASSPQISFIIGHRGQERLPHLLLTLSSILGQRDATIECIVVEQDPVPKIQSHLPKGIRYCHAPLPVNEVRYNRSAAFNAGARIARGPLLVLHDNDLLVPRDYAAEAVGLHGLGFEVGQLNRFIFYLDPSSTKQWLSGAVNPKQARMERVIENAAGGSLMVSRATYGELGGMDEDFIGWGGEDNEFLDRCLTRRIWRFGYLPLIHLDHPSLADRKMVSNPAIALLDRKRRVPPCARIAALVERQNVTTRRLV